MNKKLNRGSGIFTRVSTNSTTSRAGERVPLLTFPLPE